MRIQKSTNLPARIDSRRIRGQGMTEYIVVVALVCIAAVAAVGFFGAAVEGQFIKLGGELIGKTDETGITDAENARKEVKAGAATLGDYNAAGGGD